MKSLLREALSEAIEFVEMDLHALTPAGEAMVQRWRDALSAPDVGVGLTRYAFDATTFMGHASAVMGEDPNGEWVRHEDAAAALAAERRRAEADMRERAAQAIEDAERDALKAAHPWPEGPFAFGDRVEKAKGSSWHGQVCGWYTTSLTPIGYCVESEREPGSVQLYPAAALATDIRSLSTED